VSNCVKNIYKEFGIAFYQSNLSTVHSNSAR